ncbi:MAG: hypothetical protein ABS75_13885 [Pelagibacterium sp. SCN 63-23]|nr:MAG: hypothetical protein ABS75_13885 [Pelagibacterium sp. SCN 63-23]
MRGKSLADRTLEKRRRILDAARSVMLRDGLRGATMEGIAKAAGIAKPTLYAQFADKDAVFVGLLEWLLGDLMAAFAAGMDSEGNAAERIGAGLVAQYRLLAQMLEGSPHASELMSEHKRMGLSLADADAEMMNRVVALLDQSGVADAAGLARVVVSAAYGIALKVSDPDAMADGIRLTCLRLITPALP